MTQPLQFANEAEFEEALVTRLCTRNRWSGGVLKNPTEQDLIDNWARILFENNQQEYRLNGVPLSDSEKKTLVEHLKGITDPSAMHQLLQGKYIELVRDNPQDTVNHGKPVQLQIFDPRQIAGGDSTYQIAQQPKFARHIQEDRNRRGDIVLLIWGLPLIHVELKNHGHSTEEAIWQIRKYMQQGVYTGIMNTVQTFVAMTPEELVYFARPASADDFNKNFQFKWSRANNEYYDNWADNASSFLGIPQSHQLIGDFMIADSGDSVLKVLRPYQIHAVQSIISKLGEINRVHPEDWTRNTQKGGYIWHTTGSGKTMSSFKSAALLAREDLADKVVFVLDRIELSEQSEKEYNNFADDNVELHRPASTALLLRDLKDTGKTLIITSLHKLGRLCAEDTFAGEADFQRISNQRIVFVVDEAHRSTFGTMFRDVHNRLPHAVFIGFTGTPIYDENKRKDTITSELFGSELHRYSIAFGLRDNNVLGFNTQGVPTYSDLRQAVSIRQAGGVDRNSIGDIMQSESRKAIYDKFMDPQQVPWAGGKDEDGKYIRGIEDYADKEIWESEEHRDQVVKHIIGNWPERSVAGKFHAILATSSVQEAIAYYRLFKELAPYLKITSIFTEREEHDEESYLRDQGIREILTDYNERYQQHFSREDMASFKTDVADRLAHKQGYRTIDNQPELQLDMVIVVNQLLTGYDSKWVNTLYLDKVLKYDGLVQAFSRTNRIFNHSALKPFGSIIYFRRVHTMERNITDAFDLYAGDRAADVFADPLPKTLTAINGIHDRIKAVYREAGLEGFDRLPEGKEARSKFAAAVTELINKIETASLQGFTWSESTYTFDDTPDQEPVTVEIDEETYNVLLARLQELSNGENATDNEGQDEGSIPLDLTALAIARDTLRIDYEYLESRFTNLREALREENSSIQYIDELRAQVQNAYATLSQEDQEIAQTILNDLENGSIDIHEERTFRDYLNLYKSQQQNKRAAALHEALGISEEKISEIMKLGITEAADLTSFGRLQALKADISYPKFTVYLERQNVQLNRFKQNVAAERLIKDFFLKGADPRNWDANKAL